MQAMQLTHYDLPDLKYDSQLSHMLGVSGGPDDMARLAKEACDAIHYVLEGYGVAMPNLRFEGVLLPFLFQARRLGDARGVARGSSQLAALFPGTE